MHVHSAESGIDKYVRREIYVERGGGMRGEGWTEIAMKERTGAAQRMQGRKEEEIPNGVVPLGEE